MGNIRRKSLFIFLSIVFVSDIVLSASVDGVEKREDSYIDALHKTHVEDSLHCEC